MTQTEITKLQKAIRVYSRHLDNEPKFIEAEKYLQKVHRTYGTIDVNIIRDILR